MEHKICENCGAKLHVRTIKCPICSILLTDASKIINDDNQVSDPQEITGENIDIQVSDSEITNNLQIDNSINNITPELNNKKDYIYKAEVYHSLEYTKPLSNTLKVFLSAISTIPLIGQFIGTFMGIFFVTYDDYDRRTFGRALICLSVIMFMLYAYSLMISSEILTSGEFPKLFE